MATVCVVTTTVSRGKVKVSGVFWGAFVDEPAARRVVAETMFNDPDSLEAVAALDDEDEWVFRNVEVRRAPEVGVHRYRGDS
jgi:hypothetical protein